MCVCVCVCVCVCLCVCLFVCLFVGGLTQHISVPVVPLVAVIDLLVWWEGGWVGWFDGGTGGCCGIAGCMLHCSSVHYTH